MPTCQTGIIVKRKAVVCGAAAKLELLFDGRPVGCFSCGAHFLGKKMKPGFAWRPVATPDGA